MFDARWVTAVPAAAIVCVLGGCRLDEPLFEGTRTLHVEHVEGAAVRATTANGAIEFRRVDREDVQVVATVKAETAERLEQVQVVTRRLGDGTLELGVAWPGDARRSREGVSFDVQMPGASRVEAESSNGRLLVHGFDADAALRTSNGAVDVALVTGDVTARTSNGAITLTGVGGTIDAKSSNGRVTIREAGGPVTVETSNGAVDVELAETSAGPVDVRTSNGRIEATLSRSLRGTLSASTSNGGISVEADQHAAARLVSSSKNSLVLELAGDGAAGAAAAPTESRLRTSNGRVVIRFR